MDSWLESCALLASIFAVIPPARFQRRCPVPDHSFFLFGPRGTGKSPWLRHVLPAALWFDLLRTHTLLGLARQPESFRQQVEARPRGSWIVMDEVQRLPSLLNEVHALIAESGRKSRFALSGFSARNLKRLDVDLLAGLALDAAVAGPTVQGSFDVLVDTLIGFWLLPWQRRPKFNEVASPTFYLFDPGVARALAGRSREPLEGSERGFLLET